MSRLLNWVLNGRGNTDDAKQTESSPDVSRAKRAEAESQLTVWESEHLLVPSIKEQILSMWEVGSEI